MVGQCPLEALIQVRILIAQPKFVGAPGLAFETWENMMKRLPQRKPYNRVSSQSQPAWRCLEHGSGIVDSDIGRQAGWTRSWQRRGEGAAATAAVPAGRKGKGRKAHRG